MQETVQRDDGRVQEESREKVSIGEKEDSDPIKKMYDSACEFCFKFLGFYSFDQVDKMTIPEYLLLVKVHTDIEEEKEYDRHWRAYLNMAAQSTVQSGKKQKMRFPKFEKFYNRKEILRRIHGEKAEATETASKIIEFRNKKRGGSTT